MKHQLRRIGVLSTAKIAFFIYWAIGIVMALMYGALFGVMSAIDPTSMDPELGGLNSLIGGMGAVVLMLVGLFLSVVYGVFAAVAVGLAAAGYNLLARIIGGVEIELVPTDGSGTSGSASSHAPPASRSDIVWTPVSRPAETLPPPPSHGTDPVQSSPTPNHTANASTDPDAPWKPPTGS
jgi:hypothetical protein